MFYHEIKAIVSHLQVLLLILLAIFNASSFTLSIEILNPFKSLRRGGISFLYMSHKIHNGFWNDELLLLFFPEIHQRNLCGIYNSS